MSQRKRMSRYDVARLAAVRDEKGLTNTFIARAIRRDTSTVTRTLSGHAHHQSPATVRAIADILGVPMSEITLTADKGWAR